MKKFLLLIPFIIMGCKEPDCNVDCKGYGCFCVEDERPECQEDAVDMPSDATPSDAVSMPSDATAADAK